MAEGKSAETQAQEAATHRQLENEARTQAFNQIAVENAIERAAMLAVAFKLDKEEFVEHARNLFWKMEQWLNSRTREVKEQLIEKREEKI